MPPPKQRKKVESYRHTREKRANIPPVGLVTPETDPDGGKKKTWEYDPHIDPALQWAGKAERTSFEVPTVSLHVHERIEPRTIIEAVKKSNGANGGQPSLFASAEENPPLREAVEFYRHRHNWSNRLVAGDSLLVMNSLLEKEGMAGKVQCVYIDPPYGIKYGSNFQPFVGKRDVKDGKDDDLSGEPEMIRAFRDTWELGIHSYLSYMRDRLLLARELLSDSGSCFVQISDENVHLVRNLMDEVFGVGNFVANIGYRTRSPLGTNYVGNAFDYLIWYSKDIKLLKFREIFRDKSTETNSEFSSLEMSDGTVRPLSESEKMNNKIIPNGARIFSSQSPTSSGRTPSCVFKFHFDGDTFFPGGNKSWSSNLQGMTALARQGRLLKSGNSLRYKYYLDDFPVAKFSNIWADTYGEASKRYVVQTQKKVIQRCILMTTDPGDLVFDPTCGSGTTAFVAEQWGRRWITCDTSRVAVTLAKSRLMTATFDYYKLAYPDQGVGSGFEYETVPHVTLRSIANNEPPATETLYDRPHKDKKKARVTGPFTVEAVPAPMVKPLTEASVAPLDEPAPVDNSIAREGETLRQEEWRDELEKVGVRGKAGQRIMFSRVELFPGRHLHADAETRPDESGAHKVREPATAYKPQRAVICFGPEHAPLEQRQVENAWQEACSLAPKPAFLIFVAFQFDPEAAKDIDELPSEKAGMTLLKVQMNTDLQTKDLRKKDRSGDSFWLVGQPDVELQKADDGKWQVQVRGFDYFNTRNGKLESGGEERIAMWMLDTDYDGRSLYPRQVFFPMASGKDKTDGWKKLAKNLRAEIDEDLIGAYHGVESLPFEAGAHKRVAVKIVDDRGVESLRVIDIDDTQAT